METPPTCQIPARDTSSILIQTLIAYHQIVVMEYKCLTVGISGVTRCERSGHFGRKKGARKRRKNGGREKEKRKRGKKKKGKEKVRKEKGKEARAKGRNSILWGKWEKLSRGLYLFIYLFIFFFCLSLLKTTEIFLGSTRIEIMRRNFLTSPTLNCMPGYAPGRNTVVP